MWTWKTWDGIRRADARRTRTFGAAMSALAATPHLGAAISAYNQIMGPATAHWQDECADAIALSEDEPF
jgi:hypothetical protein